MPKISVIIPVYNVESYLQKCLNSVVNQTIGLENLEVIIVNDGSTDNSVEILEHYQIKYPSLIVLHQSNKGQAAARNEGLRIATGEYIAFLDSDDYLPLDAYEKLYNAADSGSMDIVSGIISYQHQGKDSIHGSKIFNIRQNEQIVNIKLDREYWDLLRYGMVCYRIFKLDLITKHKLRFPEGLIYEDFSFNMIANLISDKVKIIDSLVYYYVQRDGSTMRSKRSSKQYLDVFKIIEHTEHEIKRYGLEDYKYIFDTVVLDNYLVYNNRLNDLLSRRCIDLYQIAPEEYEYITSFFMSYLKNVKPEVIAYLPQNIRSIYTAYLNTNKLDKYFIDIPKNDDKPIISIIVPIYNVEKYIYNCLSSMVRQTLKNIEIIIVNDGTPDNSANIAQEFVDKYNNIKLFHKTNGGVGDARNYGIRHANGDFIMFVDSDDMLLPRSCENLYNKAVDTDSDIVIGRPVWLKKGTEEPIEYLEKWFTSEFKESYNYKMNYKIALGIPTPYPKLYRSELILQNNLQFPHIIGGEDCVFSVKAYYYANKISLIRDTVYWRVEREEENNRSATQTFSFKTVRDRIKSMNIIEDFCKEKKIKDIRINNMYQLYYISQIFLKLESLNDKELALEEFKRFINGINNPILKSKIKEIFRKDCKSILNMGVNEFENSITSQNRNRTDITEIIKHKISIILPVYNVEKYIHEALKSLENQTVGMSNIEVIMVNDASTDSSGEIIDYYAAKHENFISIHLDQKSGAAGKPRNIGVQKATGDFIMFLDPDDYYFDNACEVLYRTITEFDCDMAIGTYMGFNENGAKWKHPFYSKIKSNSIYIQSIDGLKDLLASPPSIWSKIFKRDFIIMNNIEFPEKIVAQDLVFSIHTLLAAKGIAFTQQPICNYRVRDGQDVSVSNYCDFDYFAGINAAQQLVYQLFINFDREDDYAYIIKETLDYYLKKFNESTLMDKTEKIEVLKLMRWYFLKSNEYGFMPNEIMNRPQFKKIVSGEFEEAIVYTELVEELKKVFNVNSLKELESNIPLNSQRQYSNYSAEQELQRIYNMRTWKLIQRYRRFMDNTPTGVILSKVRNKINKIIN